MAVLQNVPMPQVPDIPVTPTTPVTETPKTEVPKDEAPVKINWKKPIIKILIVGVLGIGLMLLSRIK